MHFQRVTASATLMWMNPTLVQQDRRSVRPLWDGPSRRIRAFATVREDNLKTMSGRFISPGGATGRLERRVYRGRGQGLLLYCSLPPEGSTHL